MRETQEVRAGERRPIWRSLEVVGSNALVTGLATPSTAADASTVFAATSGGVYVSRDGADRFASWGMKSGPTAVVAVAISPSYASDRWVYALGLGGTIWRRRDVRGDA
jgi:hypothetical protein